MVWYVTLSTGVRFPDEDHDDVFPSMYCMYKYRQVYIRDSILGCSDAIQFFTLKWRKLERVRWDFARESNKNRIQNL